MRMRFIGSDSPGGSCPSLYKLEDGRIVIQGQQLDDSEALSQLRDLLDGEGAVVVPRELLDNHWARRS